MSESNALLQKMGGVPTLSAGDQVLVNPLAAVQAGNQAAQSEFQTRDWQAKQAAGQAYQGAIDPKTGEFDPNKFRTLLSQSGPAALAAGAALSNTQNISSDELNQQKLKLEQYNSSLGSLMAMGDNVTHADVVSKIQSLMAHKMMTLPEAQRIMSTIPEGQAELAGWVKQHALTMADASTRFNQTIGTRQTFSTPTGDYNAPVPPPGDPRTVYVPKGPDPGATQPGGIWVDGKGAQVPEGTPGAVWQAGVRPKVGDPAFPQSGPPQLLQPGQSITPPGTPPVPPGTIPGTGRPPAGSKLLNPNRPQSAAPEATPPPEETAPGTPTPPAPVGTNPNALIRTEPPQGQPAALEANQKAYREDQAAIPSVMAQARNTAKAYEALRLLKEANSTTGIGAAAINTIRSRLTTLGLSGVESMNVQKLQEEFAKYTNQSILDAAGASSNMGKDMAAHSNPGDILSMAANFDVLRKNLGETLQKIAAAKSHEDTSGGGYIGHRGDVATETDSRGFVWDTYDPAEQAKIRAEAKRDGQKAVDKLNAAIGMSHALQLRIPGATVPPPPDKRSMLMPPPAPERSPLAMVG
jgi:hypothetical protein